LQNNVDLLLTVTNSDDELFASININDFERL